MELIDLQDLKNWRLNYIRSGRAQSYDDMIALGRFIDSAKRVEVPDDINGVIFATVDVDVSY